jgi:hypothetical protein
MAGGVFKRWISSLIQNAIFFAVQNGNRKAGLDLYQLGHVMLFLISIENVHCQHCSLWLFVVMSDAETKTYFMIRNETKSIDIYLFDSSNNLAFSFSNVFWSWSIFCC